MYVFRVFTTETGSTKTTVSIVTENFPESVEAQISQAVTTNKCSNSFHIFLSGQQFAALWSVDSIKAGMRNWR